jgi:prepilin-type N-terminal cleavage/methylation domain-containing protein
LTSELRPARSLGFTIIEVMIVLAIAGLIMLIVFLAVPALRRSAHNTAVKQDMGLLLAGVNDYLAENSNQLPATPEMHLGTGGSTAMVGFQGNACPGTTTCTEVDLGQLDSADVSIVDKLPAKYPDVDNVVIIEGYECQDGTPVKASNPRRYAAISTLEGGAQICVTS